MFFPFLLDSHIVRMLSIPSIRINIHSPVSHIPLELGTSIAENRCTKLLTANSVNFMRSIICIVIAIVIVVINIVIVVITFVIVFITIVHIHLSLV